MSNIIADIQAASRSLEEARRAFLRAGEGSLAASCSDLIHDSHRAIYSAIKVQSHEQRVAKIESRDAR